jgi:hypothetical protein
MNPNTLDISLDTASVLTKPPEPPAPRPRRELLTPLTEEGHYLLVVDNSSIETFTTCPRYAQHYLFYGREGHARNAALTFGGAVHEGCESIERGDSDVVTAQKVLKFFTENPAPPDEYRTPQAALELLAHYRVRKTLPDYEWTVLSYNSNLLVEQPFEIPLGVLEVDAEIRLPSWDKPAHVSHIHVAWSGRLDLIAICNNKNRVVDHKTTSIGGDQFVQDFQLSNQTIGYVWAAQQLWPDLNIDGFCLNAFHLKKPSAGKGLMEVGPRGGPPALNFFRAYFDYSKERLQQWEDNALVLVEDFVHCLVRGYFPLHTKWCFAKYGKCQYHDVCTIDNPDVRLKLLESDAYRDVTWNPVR